MYCSCQGQRHICCIAYLLPNGESMHCVVNPAYQTGANHRHVSLAAAFKHNDEGNDMPIMVCKIGILLQLSLMSSLCAGEMCDINH